MLGYINRSHIFLILALPRTYVEELLDLSLIAGLDMFGCYVALIHEHLLELHHAAAVPCSSGFVVHHGGRVVLANDATSLFLHLKEMLLYLNEISLPNGIVSWEYSWGMKAGGI